MFIDLNDYESNKILDFDLCIIGAGASGLAIASRFLRSNHKVCLLESGNLDYDYQTQSLYQGKNTGLPRVALDACRLRYFGGSTNHWGGWCSPLEPVDFKKREWIPNSGWPINYFDLEPYYIESNKICELGSYVYNEDLWKERNTVPIKLNNNLFSYRFWKINPIRFGSIFESELRKSKNITVLFNSNVTKLQLSENTKKIDDITIKSFAGKTARVRSKYHILACGGIENVRILLISNDISKSGIGNENDLVGRYFMDHPPMDYPPPAVRTAKIITNQKDKILNLYGKHRLKNIHTLTAFRLSDHIQEKHETLNCVAWINYLQVKPYEAKDSSENEYNLSKSLNNLKGNSTDDYKPYSIDLVCQFEQAPDPESRITLSNELDALGMKRVNVNWKLNKLDKHSIRILTELMATELTRLNLGRVKIEDWVLEQDNTWPDNLQGAWHHIGTTRMSDDPRTGVVDKNCKVHNIHNLFISGCSVFPTSGYANPTLTIIALSLRLADNIKNILNSS